MNLVLWAHSPTVILTLTYYHLVPSILFPYSYHGHTRANRGVRPIVSLLEQLDLLVHSDQPTRESLQSSIEWIQLCTLHKVLIQYAIYDIYDMQISRS
jgi:hypothetical protein